VSELLRFVGLVALLLVGSAGWGSACVSVLRRLGWGEARTVLRPPLQLALGIAVFLAVGGFLVAVDAAWFWVLLGWHVAGVVLAGARLSTLARTGGLPRLPPALSSAATVAAAAFVGLLSLGVGIGFAVNNPNDDDPAYIYFAQRLLHTGGLVDPFNFRRVTSYGGSTLYQSLFLRVTGVDSLRGFEYCFAALVLVAVAVGTLERRWLPLGTVLIGAGLFVGYAVGPVRNLSATFSVAVLALSAWQLLGHVRPAPEADQPLLYVVLGLDLAALASLRFYFVIPVGFAVVAALYVVRRGAWVRPLGVVIGTGVVGLVGWAAASWRASGTPFFAVAGGNFVTSVPNGGNPLLHGVGTYARLFWAAFRYDGVGLVAVAAVVVGVGHLLASRQRARPMVVLVFAGLGCLLELAVLTYLFSGSDVNDRVRFEAPATLACGLLLIDALWPLRRRAGQPAAAAPARAGGGGLPWARLAPAATLVLLLAVVGELFGGNGTTVRQAVASDSRAGYRVLTGRAGFHDPYAADEAAYRQLDAMVPHGARLLVAVNQPALLDYGTYSFATLDVPGYTSPPPHLPLFSGAQDQVSYLRRLGFDYIVAESPNAIGFYGEGQWLNEIRVQGYYYRAWAVYFLNWDQTVRTLETDRRYQVRYAGPLALIRI